MAEDEATLDHLQEMLRILQSTSSKEAPAEPEPTEPPAQAERPEKKGGLFNTGLTKEQILLEVLAEANKPKDEFTQKAISLGLRMMLPLVAANPTGNDSFETFCKTLDLDPKLMREHLIGTFSATMNLLTPESQAAIRAEILDGNHLVQMLMYTFAEAVFICGAAQQLQEEREQKEGE